MDKKSSILARVIHFSNHLGVSLRSFSLSIGASPGYLHRLQSAKSNIGGDFIEKIIQLYPQLNPSWLVTGEEDMIKPSFQVGESETIYEKRDRFKETLLSYLNDEEIKKKIQEVVDESNKDQKKK